MAEGYVKIEKGKPVYVYNYTDHLGNVRLSYTDKNGIAQVLQEKNYYPFGLTHKGYNESTDALAQGYKYGYNGKELQNEVDLNWYDYGARNYSPALGRWFVIDPLAEETQHISPYGYALNNPVYFIDPDGRFVSSPIYDELGNFLGTDDQGLQGEAIFMNAADFMQGMSHANALSAGQDLFQWTANADIGMINKFANHFEGLSKRPDWDGYLTFGEVTKWSNQGSGNPLFVDANKINLNSISTVDFKNFKSRSIDFFGEYFHPETGPIYGHMQVTLLNSSTGDVRLGLKNTLLDKHDFSNSFFKTINDYLYPGTPKDFNIYCAPCNTKIRTEAEVKRFRKYIYKVMSERPKF